MTKNDLVNAVAAHGLSKRQSSSVVESVFDIIFRCFEKGEDVKIVGFGHFRIRRKASRRKASVLVVDDDPDVREYIAESLGDYGYAVREAADGARGLEAFADKRPDLVILDYAMPGMSGSEVAARMLRDVPGQPILFVSGYNETEAIRAAAPDALLLAKPFRPDALDAAVRECLDRGKKG